MTLKIILLLIFAMIAFAPVVLSDKLKVDENETKQRRRPRWTGPRTDERINRMLAECIELMKELGVPISKSICPEVILKGTYSYFGRCCSKGSLKNYTEYAFYIELSGFILENTEKSLRNTLIHELIHTVPGGLRHRGEWKKWAKYVSERTDYHISYCGCEDETEEDLQRIRGELA